MITPKELVYWEQQILEPGTLFELKRKTVESDFFLFSYEKLTWEEFAAEDIVMFVRCHKSMAEFLYKDKILTKTGPFAMECKVVDLSLHSQLGRLLKKLDI